MIQSLSCTGLESTYGLYPPLSHLLSLLEVEEAGSSLQQHLQQLAGNATAIPTRLHDDHDHSLDFIKDWKERLPLLNSDFQFVDPVLSTRCSLLHCLLQSAAAEVKGHSSTPPTGLRRRVEHLFGALTESLLTRAEFAREAGSFQVCESALFSLKQRVSLLGSYGIPESLYPALPWTLKIEEAKLSWERKDTTQAMTVLKTLLNKFTMVSWNECCPYSPSLCTPNNTWYWYLQLLYQKLNGCVYIGFQQNFTFSLKDTHTTTHPNPSLPPLAAQ